MWMVFLDTTRIVLLGMILLFLWRTGRARGLHFQKGWNCILVGWFLIFIGCSLEFVAEFALFSWLTDPNVQVLLQLLGSLLGYFFLFFGFVYWLPAAAQRIDCIKNVFVSTVSHELRTPLTSIVASIKLVASGVMGCIPDKARDTLQIANRNCDRLTLLVNDILDIEKLESGKLDFHFECTDILELVKDAIQTNKAYGEMHEVRFVLRENSVSGMVDVDSVRIMQIMTNLLSNAAKYSRPNSIVEVGVENTGDCLRTSVRDKGKGIPKSFRPFLFQKFARAYYAENHHKGGTGLGLAISRELVERMNGLIGYHASEEGSVFYFDLPETGIRAPERIKQSQPHRIAFRQ